MTHAAIAYLTPSGQLARATVALDAPRIALPLPPAPPVVVPPQPDPERWTLVPDGTLVTDAIETLVGANPVQDANGIICLHKNTFPECEWRRVDGERLLHWADASRFHGDPGWWTEPAAVLCYDTFYSGAIASLENATIIDMRPGVPPNRWRQTTIMRGIVGGGVFYGVDPRFPNQYTDMTKWGTPEWAPAGYEKQWTRHDGWAKWQYIVTPLTAKGVIPWGDPSMDIVIQDVETAPQPPSAPLPFVPCPRPLTTTPVPPQPPTEPDMTDDEIRRFTAALDDPLVFGALQRFHNEVLPRDRPADPVKTAEGGVFNTADVVTGGAFAYFVRKYVSEAIIAQGHGRTAAQASGDGYDAAIKAYTQVVNPPTTTPVPPTGTIPVLSDLHIVGTTFREWNGLVWKYRMVTAFTAFQDFLAGDKKLDAYANWTRSVGCNGWRIFYTWAGTNFNPTRLGATTLRNEMEDFRRYMTGQGLYAHNTVFCDQVNGSPVLLSGSDRDLLLDTTVGVWQGSLVEEMNESWQNGGSGKFANARFAGAFATRSSWQDGGVPTDAGSILDFTSEHTPRDAEWPRKAKNMLETSTLGIGSFHATGKPAIGGEPIGIHEVEIPGSRTANASDVADYFAVAELYSVGACLHGDGSTLQRCNVPGPVAQQCAEWAKAAREAIPTDAQLGSYTRGGLDDCPIEHSDSTALRTFFTLSGNRGTGVVVRPTGGWKLVARNGWRIDGTAGPNGHIIHVSR